MIEARFRARFFFWAVIGAGDLGSRIKNHPSKAVISPKNTVVGQDPTVT